MPPHTALEERFWKYVDKSQDDECWLWTGYLRPNGYGQISNLGKVLKAHRVSYEIHHGPIPTGGYILHSCDTPACVNPSHLRVGTQRENLLEAASRSRTNTKLSVEQAREIKNRKAAGESGPQLAREYGVDHSTIYRIVNGHFHLHA